MITDNSLIFCSAQAITAAAASTNTIDFGATGTPYGFTNPLVQDYGHYDDDQIAEIAITVGTAFNNLTSMTVGYQTSPDNATWTDGADLTVPLSALVAGYQFHMRRTPEGSFGRYHRLYFTPNGTAPTAGTISAQFVASRQTNLSFGGA